MDLFLKFIRKDYYTGILERGQGVGAFRLIIFLSLLAVVLPAIQIFRFTLPFVRSFSTEVRKLVAEIYPTDLEIIISSGTVQTNVIEPYFISISNQTLEKLAHFNINTEPIGRTRIIAIDTHATSDDLDKYQSMALLTADSFVYQSESKTESISLKEVQDFTLNKSIIDRELSKFLDHRSLNWILYGLLVTLPLLLFAFTGIGIGLEFLWFTVLIYFICRIYRLSYTFSRLYQFVANLSLPFSMASFLWGLIPGVYKFEDLNAVTYIIILALAHYLLSNQSKKI